MRFDRGLFDRFLRASAIMVMDEREPILRGAKAPAHAQSQSYDAEATLGGPAEGRASRDAAIEPVRNSSRRGFRVSVALLAVIGLVAGVASGVARSAASDASSVAPSASEASEGKGARVTATDTRFREVFSRSFAEASNEAFVETIAAASAAGRRDHSRSPSPQLGQGPVHDLDTPCDGAVREPVGYGTNGVFTETMLSLLDYADAVYIICTSNCLMTIPEVLRGKVLMVDGFRVDQCLGSGASTHWIKASLTHGYAIAHARRSRVKAAAMLEEDFTSLPNPMQWSQRHFDELNWFLGGEKKDEWRLIRLGYRPVNLEGGAQQCDGACLCAPYGTALCYIRGAGCPLNSADAYIIRDNAYEQVLSALSSENIIDYGVLQSLDKTLVLTPQISYQKQFSPEDFQDLTTQLQSTGKFYDACMKPQLSAHGDQFPFLEGDEAGWRNRLVWPRA